MKYDITENRLLSPAALALEQEELEAQALVAELALGIRDTSYSGDAATDMANAVALQVNLQVERGVDGDVYQSYSQGARSFTLRDVPIAPTAVAIVRHHQGGQQFLSFHSRLCG